MDLKKYRITDGKDFKLADHATKEARAFKKKAEVKQALKDNVSQLKDLQDRLYAQDKYALLLIFQAMDAAGKDSTIEHVMSGVNPQGCEVFSFKQPSKEEMDHSYLWRCQRREPERGRIGIFNRSYYEEVLIVKVHDLVKSSQLPKDRIDDQIWQRRYQHIRNYENYLYDNAIIPIKFFLNVSKEEQKNRFLKRIDRPEKNWKFAMGDVKERQYWDDYQKAYQKAISETASKAAPWYVIPADDKWHMRYLVSSIIIKEMNKLDLKYPKLDDAQLAQLGSAKEALLED